MQILDHGEIDMILFGIGTTAVAAVFLLLVVAHLKEQKKYKEKMKVYRSHGGRPYENPRHVKNKKAWEEQDRTNRMAREAASLGEYANQDQAV
jgi:hypothetical protein